MENVKKSFEKRGGFGMTPDIGKVIENKESYFKKNRKVRRKWIAEIGKSLELLDVKPLIFGWRNVYVK
jgi:hypothetical protein